VLLSLFVVWGCCGRCLPRLSGLRRGLLALFPERRAEQIEPIRAAVTAIVAGCGAADTLGLPLGQVRVLHGSTAWVVAPSATRRARAACRPSRRPRGPPRRQHDRLLLRRPQHLPRGAPKTWSVSPLICAVAAPTALAQSPCGRSLSSRRASCLRRQSPPQPATMAVTEAPTGACAVPWSR
jgi:hypothetical protein